MLRLGAARQLKNQGSALRASKEYEVIVPLFRASGDRVLYGRVLLEASEIAVAIGDYPHAIERATEAAGIYAGQGDVRNEAMAVNFVGLARLYRGEYAAALQSFQRALENDVRLQDASGEITRLNNINVYFFQGKYLDALQIRERALQGADQTTGEKWNPGRRS